MIYRTIAATRLHDAFYKARSQNGGCHVCAELSMEQVGV